MKRRKHAFGNFTVTVEDDIADAAVARMAEAGRHNNPELFDETGALLADLFEWCRGKVNARGDIIAIQMALRFAADSLARPDHPVRIKRGRAKR